MSSKNKDNPSDMSAGEERASVEDARPVNLSSGYGQGHGITEYWEGRTDFSALFQGAPPAGIDLMPAFEQPEKKVEFLRDKLLEVEMGLLNFKEAWGVREREMDRLEAFYRANRDHVIELHTDFRGQVARARLLEDELGCTKFELSQYVQELQQLETSKRDAEKRLKAEAEQREAELCEARDVSRVRRDELSIKNRGYLHEVSQLKKDLKILQRRYQELQLDREHKVKELQARLGQESEQVQLLEREVEQQRDTFHRELLIRNEVIEKLKKVVLGQRESLGDRDSRIKGLLEQVRQMEGLYQATGRELEQSNEAPTESNRQLRVDVALLRKKVETLKQVNHRLQEESRGFRKELESAEVLLFEFKGKTELSDGKIDGLNGLYDTLREQYSEQEEVLRETAKKLKETLTNLVCIEGKNVHMGEENGRLMAKLDDQRSHHQALERQLAEARALSETKEQDWRRENEKRNEFFESSGDELRKEIEIRD